MKRIALLLALVIGTSCSVKKFAINKLGNALAESGDTYASDNDPELVEGAVPFSLKLIESLLAESPRHRGLLFAASSGFTQYAYIFVQQKADEIEDEDYGKAEELRARTRKLFLRARDYGLRGLETRYRDFGETLRADPKAAVAGTKKKDVPLLYWTAASWGLAISLSKDDPETIADQPVVEALIDRALELDEAFDDGAIHSFLIAYEPSRIGATGDAAGRCRKHFERAVELSGGSQAGPYVSVAEAVSLDNQDRKEFESLLGQALEIDVDAKPEFRLVNIIMQRRARWLLGRVDDLFLE